MALDTVQDYIDRARVLLLDASVPYRYTDDELRENLNLGIMEIRRLRPDVLMGFFGLTLPEFTTLSDSVPVDPQYRMALLYYVLGQAQLRDEENTQDSRAVAFLNKFVAQLTTLQA